VSEYVGRVVRAHLYGTLVIGIFVVLPVLGLKRLDPLLGLRLPEILGGLGMVILVAGAALSYTSFWFFIQEGKGTAFPTDPPRTLVVGGPYLYVRNPMYVGNLAIILGAALYFASPVVLAYGVLMCVVTHVYITASEEPVLIRRYQGAYVRYLETTPRWLPRLSAGGPGPRARTGYRA
jgi:protein-S-isoprenylcysteine O-methyltransferase Ste14